MKPLQQHMHFSAPFTPSAPLPSPEEVEQLRIELLELMERNATAAFADLAAHARDVGFEAGGDGNIYHGSPSRNVILYPGVNRLFFTAVNMLVLQKEVYLVQCRRTEEVARCIDDRVGELVDENVRAKGSRRPTWLPVLFLTVPF